MKLVSRRRLHRAGALHRAQNKYRRHITLNEADDTRSIHAPITFRRRYEKLASASLGARCRLRRRGIIAVVAPIAVVARRGE